MYIFWMGKYIYSDDGVTEKEIHFTLFSEKHCANVRSDVTSVGVYCYEEGNTCNGKRRYHYGPSRAC